MFATLSAVSYVFSVGNEAVTTETAMGYSLDLKHTVP